MGLEATIVLNERTPPAGQTGRAPACAHCGLDVPAGLMNPTAERQFCCHGCQSAHEIIHSCGLDRYYQLAREAERGGPVKSSSRTYVEFDHDVFRDLHVRGARGRVCEVDLFLQGIHCGACVWLVERLTRVVPGVLEARLDFRRAIVRVIWDDAAVPLSSVARALDSLGYPPHPARDAGSRTLRMAEDRVHLIRLAVAGACAGNVMLLGLALYAGLFDAMDAGHRSMFRWASLGITAVSLAWPGSVFFRAAWAALRTKTAHLDIPIALALLAGGLWSAWATVTGRGEIYFDSLAVLVFALLVGRFFQHRQQRWSSDAIELLFCVTPGLARRVEQGTISEVPVEALRIGDLVEVRAGDVVPADGVVATPGGTFDQSLLTGEARPVPFAVGGVAPAGALNVGSAVQVRVQATGADTRIGRIMSLVEESARRRAPIVRLADRAAGWFVIGMVSLSAVTLGVWLWKDPAHAVDHAVALLIVTCPCALGLATPLALTAALGRAAREGIMIKGGDVVQRLATPGVLFLDKTGTITQGRPGVVRWIGASETKPLVAALERTSNHPLAVALSRDLNDDRGLEVCDATHTLGGGLEGTVAGRRVAVGSVPFIESVVGMPLDSAAECCVREGLTPVLVAVDGVHVATIGLGDAIRPDAADAIRDLRRAGWRIGVLSGDDPRVAAAVAAQVGIEPSDVRGGLTPEQKAAIVADAAVMSTAVMVGDGVNDAAALAAASVGIAVHGGAEAAMAAADVYIARPGLRGLVDLMAGCRRTMGVVRRNLAASVAYNVLAAAGAVVGLIGPLAAAVVMPISSLTVVTLSFKSRTFGERS